MRHVAWHVACGSPACVMHGQLAGASQLGCRYTLGLAFPRAAFVAVCVAVFVAVLFAVCVAASDPRSKAGAHAIMPHWDHRRATGTHADLVGARGPGGKGGGRTPCSRFCMALLELLDASNLPSQAMTITPE